MGTRGLYGFRKDGIDKVTYNHDASYPSYLGVAAARFLVSTTPEMMKKIYDSIVIVDENVPPTSAQIKECVDAGYYDKIVSKKSTVDWYCLLRNFQGNLMEYRRNASAGRKTYMIDSISFIRDSLFCEYAYIFNLDTQKGNRYGEKPDEEGYYPCRLCLEIPFGTKDSPGEIAKQMRRAKK